MVRMPKSICIVLVSIILLTFSFASAEIKTSNKQDKKKLYAAVSLIQDHGKKGRNLIDFLFIVDHKGKLTNARTIINSMGHDEFAAHYLNNQNYFFIDEANGLITVKNIVFEQGIADYGGPSLYGNGEIMGSINQAGNQYLVSATKKELKKIAVQDGDQTTCEMLKGKSEKISHDYFKKNIELKKIERPEGKYRLDSIKSENYYYADFDGDNKLDMVVAWNGTISTYHDDHNSYYPYPYPILIFVYGSGEEDIVENIGQKIEKLYGIKLIGLADLDNDNYLDVVVEGTYYESHFYSVIKGKKASNRMVFKTSIRCADCSQ